MKPQLTLLKLPSLLLVTGTLLLMVSTLAACGAARPGSAIPVATMVPTPTLDPNDKYAWDRARAPELTSIALTPPPTQQWPLPTVTPDLTPPWPPGTRQTLLGSGIIYDGQPPMGSAEFKLKSTWAELLSDHIVYVATGGEGYMGDRTQGVLFISARTLSNDLISEDMYRTPTKAGPVTITDAVGERLTLQADDGTRFYFDVPTRRWVNP